MRTNISYDENRYYTGAAAADGDGIIRTDGFIADCNPNIIIDDNVTTGDYNPFIERTEKRVVEVQLAEARGKIDDLEYALRVVQDKNADLITKTAVLSADYDTRNKAIENVIELVTLTVKLTLKIYKAICAKVDEEQGSYACNFIAEAVLNNINEEAKSFMTTSTSRRRINIPGDHKVTTKKQHSKIELAFDRLTLPQ